MSLFNTSFYITSLLPLLALTLTACVIPEVLGENDTDTGSTGSTGSTGDTEGPPEGVEVWDKVLPDIDGYDLAVAGDGTFYVVGASSYAYEGGDAGTFANTWIGHFDADGLLLWDRPEPIVEGFPALVSADVTPEGELLVAAVDWGALDGGGNRVIKLDPSGSELWSAILPARARAVTATLDGGAVIGGTQSTGDNSGVAWALGLDAAGAQIWEETWGDPEMRSSIVNTVELDGASAVLGGRLGVEPLSTRSQAWLARVDVATGATVWERTVSDAITTDEISDLGIDGAGQIVAMARIDTPVVRAFASGGEDLWSMSPLTSGGRIAVAADGSFVLADGIFLPEEDPDACLGVFSPCPVSLRAVRHDADQAIRWSAEGSICRSGRVPAILPDDRVLVLADCSVAPVQDVGLGLLLFAP